MDARTTEPGWQRTCIFIHTGTHTLTRHTHTRDTTWKGSTNGTAQGASSCGLLKIDEITVRGRANAEPIYSWHPLPPDAQEAHDGLLEAILAKTAPRRRKQLLTALDQLAAMDGYPQGLADYYRRRIGAL